MGLLHGNCGLLLKYRHNWPIAAHFHSAGLKFACFSEDFGEAVGEAVEASVCVPVWEGAAEDHHEVLGGEQGIDEAVEASAQRWGRSVGLRSQMPGLGASQLELALEIGEGDIDVAHGHGRIDVTK